MFNSAFPKDFPPDFMSAHKSMQTRGEGRRGLGPRNDVLTTCKAVTSRNGQRICAVYFSQRKYFRGKKRTIRGSNSKNSKNNIMHRDASCENIVLISFKRMYGKWLPPARTQASPSELLKHPLYHHYFLNPLLFLVLTVYHLESWRRNSFLVLSQRQCI